MLYSIVMERLEQHKQNKESNHIRW